MLIPLIITNSKTPTVPDVIFKQVNVKLFEQHYDEGIPFDNGTVFEVRLLDFMPPAEFEVVQILPAFPFEIARRSFVLQTDDVNWFDMQEWAPSEKAYLRALQRIEALLIAELKKAPEARS